MKPNQQAEEFFDYYINMKSNPDYAIMIEGPWGSGKTYFIKNYFEKRASKKQKSSDTEYLYASLFGVKSSSDISEQFFAQLHPNLLGRKARAFTPFLIRGANIALDYFKIGKVLDTSDSSILERMLMNIENKILVFDDLERCSMPLMEIMGVINGYIEHDKNKVIIIASENDLPKINDKDKNLEYFSRKEKLVGKTIRINPNLKSVIKNFASEITSEIVISTIDRNMPVISRIVSASGQPNFRSLRVILQDYDRLIIALDAKLSESPEALDQLLAYTLAVGIEHRKGNLPADSFSRLPDFVSQPEELSTSANEKSKQVTPRKMYPDVIWTDPIIPPTTLAELFTTGLIDVERNNQFLFAHPLIAGPEKTPAWRNLWSFHNLPSSDYILVRSEFKDDLQFRKLCHPGEILHAAGILLRLAKLGDFVLGKTNLVNYFKHYLSDLEKSKILKPAPDLFNGGFEDSYLGLIYNENSSELFQKIRLTVKEAADKTFDELMKENAKKLLAHLKINPEKNEMLYEHGIKNGNYGGHAILHFTTISDFSDLLIIDSQLQPLIKAVQRRFYQTSQTSPLKPEFPWLRKLVNELRHRAKKLQPPHRKVVELRLSQHFDELLSSLDPIK